MASAWREPGEVVEAIHTHLILSFSPLKGGEGTLVKHPYPHSSDSLASCGPSTPRVTLRRGAQGKKRMDWLFAQPLDSVSVLSNRIILIIAMTGFASAALAALGMMTVGGGKYAALGTIAVPISFLAGFFFFLGLPPTWSTDPLHILPYIILFGLLCGIVIDIVTHIENVRLAVVLGWPAIVVVGIGWQEMPDFVTIAGLPMAVLWLSAVLGYLWMGLEHKSQSTPIVCLLAITIGLGLLAYVGDSKILTVLSGILTAALLGFFALNWPNVRFPLLATGNLGVAGAVLSLAVMEALYTTVPVEAIALLLLVLVMPWISQRLPFGSGAKMGQIVLLLTCLFPIAGAVALALRLKG